MAYRDSPVSGGGQRIDLLRKTLYSFDHHYAGQDIEVIIVNDGGKSPDVSCDFPLTIIDLPPHDEPMNPCVPFNRGAECARGEFLCIQNPESKHRTSVFPEALESLRELGPKGYVMAACFDVGMKKWYCHSERQHSNPRAVPPGFGLHYCVVLYSAFWREFGGFDEGYRNGAGYDDNDLAYRVAAAGGVPLFRDDLIVEHHRTKTGWKPHGFEVNRKIFERKWL